MKNLQTHFLKFHLFMSFFFFSVTANSQTASLQRADSLFQAKKYTQSLEIYQSLLQQNQYSQAMLLKMAYVHEALGHIGQSLYCLKLYELATSDQQVVEKMQELASKYGLAGYEENDSSRMYRWVSKNLPWMEGILVAIVFVLVLLIYFLKKKNQPARFAIVITFLVAIGVLYLNNFVAVSSVITNQDQVYLMEGPSGGSSVRAIVRDGNQLQVIGKQDVWLKVMWNDKIAFVKETNVLPVEL
jgi:hypothetical protein